MIAFRQILCPMDFSDFSRHALDHAVAIAHWYGGTVTALYVVHPIPYADPQMAPAIVFTPDDLDRLSRELEEFVRGEVGGNPIGTAVVQGNAAPAIVDKAKALTADLIVLGTHGRSGFERLMLGSVTERVLRKADCPVLTVPRRVPDAVPVGPVVFRRILCAVDFSPSSLKALAYAASLANQAPAQLTLMHAIEPVPIYEPVIAGAAMPNYEALAMEAMKVGFTTLHRAATVSFEVVTTGKPYREFLQQAEKDHSDLIVIGVHGHVADRIGFFGSTTNHIVREAACPVLSLRA